MSRLRITLSLFAFFCLLAFTSSSDADVVFNINPGAGGSTTLEIIGTGQVTDNSSSDFSSSADVLLFEPDSVPIGAKFTDLAGLGISLGGQSANGIFVIAVDDPSDFSMFEFYFEGNVPIGSELSDMNGIYTINDTDFSFEGFLPGQYVLQRDFGLSIGSFTVNVSAVPEPSSVSVLLLALAAHMSLRSRKQIR